MCGSAVSLWQAKNLHFVQIFFDAHDAVKCMTYALMRGNVFLGFLMRWREAVGHEEKITRRGFLKTLFTSGAVAVATPSAFAGWFSREPEKVPNVFDALGGATFTIVRKNSDGEYEHKQIGVRELKTLIKGRHVVLSFGVDECDDYCGNIQGNIAKLCEGNEDKLVNISIHAEPDIPQELGRSTEEMKRGRREGYYRFAQLASLPSQEVIVLSPENNKAVVTLANALGKPANRANARNHPTSIMLFKPDGTLLDSIEASRANISVAPLRDALDASYKASEKPHTSVENPIPSNVAVTAEAATSGVVVKGGNNSEMPPSSGLSLSLPVKKHIGLT